LAEPDRQLNRWEPQIALRDVSGLIGRARRRIWRQVCRAQLGDPLLQHGDAACPTDPLGAPIYFCDSRSPWQRGSNENTNGLLRDYFPRGTDLSVHAPEHLLAVENELNNRPRRVLDDQAPAALFTALLASKSPSVLRR